MFSTHVAKQQTTVPRTKDNLAKVTVLLQHEFAFLTLNIYPTTQNTILSKYQKSTRTHIMNGESQCVLSQRLKCDIPVLRGNSEKVFTRHKT